MSDIPEALAEVFAVVLPTAASAFGVLALTVASFFTVGIFFQPRWIVRVAAQLAPKVLFEHRTSDNVIALTIDDGPNGHNTHKILDVLQVNDCRATFFLIGNNVDRWPDLVRRMHQEGHEVGNHTMADEASWLLPQHKFERSLLDVDSRLEPLFKRKPCGTPVKWFRPGHGWYTQRIREVAETYGYQMALGSIFPMDVLFKDFGAPLAKYCLWKTYPGAVIILHDRPQEGTQTVQILRQLLPELKGRGYKVVTLSELVGAVNQEQERGVTCMPQ